MPPGPHKPGEARSRRSLSASSRADRWWSTRCSGRDSRVPSRASPARRSTGSTARRAPWSLVTGRAGGGLATIATPRSALAIYQAGEPGNLVAECEDGGAFARLLEDERRNSLLIGPGAGVNERTRVAVLAALATRRAVVLDADAITTFAQTPASLFDAIKGQAFPTPHT